MSEAEKTITTEEIANMSEQEILDILLFKSFFTTENLVCQCRAGSVTHLLGMLPAEFCEKSLEELDLLKIKDFQSKVSGLCQCQRPHFYDIKLSESKLNIIPTEDGEISDPRSLRLPNFRK